MENVLYEIENYEEEEVKTIDKRVLHNSIDSEKDEIKSIKKTYKYGKQMYRMTLFSAEHHFSTQEYIEHYRSLPDFYGKDALSDFDVSIIRKMNH